jgi:PAT family beta-lactamase induction signal transducer AmpG
MLTSGAGALFLAAWIGWQGAYTIMALCMSLGIVAVLMTPLPDTKILKRQVPWKRAVFISWKGLVRQPYFIPLLLFIFCFKFPDTILNAMSASFFFELGVSKLEFAEISKVFGVSLMIFGALVGGLSLRFLGDLHGASLAIFLQIVSSLMFVVLSITGHNLPALFITVGVESFASGMTSTVFIAYLSKFCLSPHTATHFTLLYSFGSLCRVLTSSGAAYLADRFDWGVLFTLSALGAVPGLAFLVWLERDKLSNFTHKLARFKISS